MNDPRGPGRLEVDERHLTGRTAIVTGAARGVGRAVLAWLHARGVYVVAEDLRPEVAELAEQFPGTETMTADVTDERAAVEAVALARRRFGGLHILVNNAGRTVNKPLVETTVRLGRADGRQRPGCVPAHPRGLPGDGRRRWRRLDRQHRLLRRHRRAAGGLGLQRPKGALTQLTKVTALEGGPLGIRANVVAAGVIDTDILDSFREDGREYLRSFASALPLRRIAQPEEIAEAVGFLAGERSSFVTGAVLAADGGITAA